MTPRWTVVVPVKGTADSKSRLAPDRTAEEREALAAAFATDAVAALLAAPSVAEVVVVAPPGELAAALAASGARVVPDPGEGLNSAVSSGLAAAAPGPQAAMLGDLPALRPQEVEAALAAAAAHPLAFVADAAGTGTTLLTASDTTVAALVPRFGAGSAARHAAAGHVDLAQAAGPGLRRDVDTEADLDAVAELPLGPATSTALARHADARETDRTRHAG